MPGGLNQLAARKRALIEESEAQREVLVGELHHLSLSAFAFQRRLKIISTTASILGFVTPVIGSLLRSRFAAHSPPARNRPKRSLLGTVMTGWRLYRRVAPVLQTFITPR